MTKLLFIILAITIPASASQTWFVRPGGGQRATTPGTTFLVADGLADVDCPGVPTATHCAFNDFRYLWDDDARGGGLGTWIIAGGDTVVIRGCTALPTQSNPSNPHCRLGWDQNNGGAGNSWCFAIGPYACSNPTIPAGTSLAHTRFLGGCAYDGTPCTPINNGYPYGTTNEAQIFEGFGLQYGFVLSNSSFIDISGIEFTTHNGVCSHGGAPGYPHPCNTSTPEDYSDNGITFASVTSDTPAHDITLTDVYVHGFSSSGLFGPIGANIAMTRVFAGFNAFAGFNFNDNSNDTNGVNASIAASYVTMIGDGCTEQYPIVNAQYPALGCWDTNSGGFGDAWSGQSCLFSVSPTCVFVSFTFDHGLIAYNTKDGFIGPHVPYNTLSITNSRFFGNMGQQMKYGGNPNSTLLVQNNFIEGNCNRMSSALPGAVQNFNQSTALGGSYLTGYCRAGGDVIETLTQIGSTQSYYGNTFVINGQDGLQFDCGPVGGGATNCNTVSTLFKDNIFLGYTNPVFGSASHLFEINAGTNITITSAFNTEVGLIGMDPCGVNGIICASPQLVGQPATPWPAGGESAFDSFNFYPTSPGSPAIGAGTPLGGLTTDFYGVTRPNPPTIGAAEPSGAPPVVATPTASPVAGTYTSTQSVVLSTTTGGATICYTINGSTPGATTAGTCDVGSTTYAGAITVATTTTIKAIGTLSGDTNSGLFSGLYTITPPAPPQVQGSNFILHGTVQIQH